MAPFSQRLEPPRNPGRFISTSDFSEFTAAYEAFRETTRHREEIRRELELHSKPIVFVEGDYDIRYLERAAELLGKAEVLGSVQVKDGGGFGNLDKIWKGYDNSLSEIIPSKIVLLYDCDTRKQNTNRALVYKRVIPSIPENPISSGIENLFSENTIRKVEEHNPRFIDSHNQMVSRIRGELTTIPASKSVNKDEKGNMCNWLCENGTADDFERFLSVFQLIEEIIFVE